MKPKLFFVVILTLFFTSCKKENATPATNNNNNNVSGKIKRMIIFAPGTRQAGISEFEFDSNNRVVKLSTWSEDSSFTPIKVSDQLSTRFFYNGTDDKPFRDSFFSANNSYINSNLFYYDIQGRLIKKEFIRTNGTLKNRSLLTYAMNSVVLNDYQETFAGSGILEHVFIDTFFYDAQFRNTETRFYDWPNTLTGKQNYTYDNKSNPLAQLNIYKTLILFSGADNWLLDERAANNVLTDTIKSDYYGSLRIEARTSTYTYSGNGYPVSCAQVITNNLPSPAIYSYNIKYEYY